MKNKAVVLLSGGLDSATTLAIAKNQGFEVYALSFDYGQRQRVELKKAKEIAKKLAVADHQIMTIDLRQFGGSALTDSIDVPMNRDEEEMSKEIPITYVPARNTIFLSFCLAYAEVKTAQNIFLGVNACHKLRLIVTTPPFNLTFTPASVRLDSTRLWPS